jgi:phosphate uptake regulator
MIRKSERDLKENPNEFGQSRLESMRDLSAQMLQQSREVYIQNVEELGSVIASKQKALIEP